MTDVTQVKEAPKRRAHPAWFWISGIGLFLFLGGLFALWMGAPSAAPMYNGRSAHEWLEDVFGNAVTGQKQRDAVDAFKKMGPDGVTFLIDSLDQSDSG